MGAACQRSLPRQSPDEIALPPPAPVRLHIYDVGTSGEVKMINRVLRPLGAGAFHCGVEVFGLEWSYGDYEQGTGVFNCRPQCCEGHTYSESVNMGKTSMLEAEFKARMKMMEVRWLGKDYDLLKKNCCHFSDEVLTLLNVACIPAWVTKLANAGAAVAAAGERIEQRRKSLGTLLAAQVAENVCCGCDVHSAGKQSVEVIPSMSVHRACPEGGARRYEDSDDELERGQSPWPDAFVEAKRSKLEL
mmetsp:Transcript_143179/g.373099  ORF Transcript_143179/g.373099 Transcript_143179/m.373099 type:complete len:246 (+) Transcript_143179:110-847(+)